MQARLEAEKKENEDAIVYFNVHGDICCVRKSTIVTVAPDSQLTARVSGGPIGDDDDEDGRIFIESSPGIFRKLISYLRLEVMLGERKTLIRCA